MDNKDVFYSLKKKNTDLEAENKALLLKADVHRRSSVNTKKMLDRARKKIAMQDSKYTKLEIYAEKINKLQNE